MMKLEKITVPAPRELFVNSILEKILSGELSIGEKLPNERELAEETGLSRPVISAGIKTLVSQGFLTVKPRQGTFVADYKREGTLDTLNAILALRGDVLTNNEIRSILEIRWALEHLTMKNAIERITDKDLSRIRKITDDLKDAQTPQEAAECCFAFQRELAVLGGNEILALIMTSFRPPVIALWKRFCRKYGIRVLYEHTMRSFAFIAARDYEGALRWLDLFTEDAISGDFTVYTD